MKTTAFTSMPAKMLLLGTLYFSQGLPFGFFTQALPVLLRQQGLSLGEIGLASLLTLPWALKFLWAPVIDRYSTARFGRRKSWIVPLQLASVVILSVLAATADSHSMAMLMTAVLLLNLAAATQDIATDGLAVDMLERAERGFANGLQVAGYRAGMIVGGGVLLILHDRLGPALTFAAMAALTALATLPIAMAREQHPTALEKTPETGVHFLRRSGAPQLLLLIFIYKAGDAFAVGMLRPFLADAGLSLADIGWLLGTVGFVAGLLGALGGGAAMNRLDRKTALMSFGLLQALAVAGYAYLATGPISTVSLYVVCAAEHFAGGMATAALFTCMMDWCSPRTSATDYTVQASAVVIATGIAQTLAGFSAQAFGYFQHFCLATVLAVAALGVVYLYFPSAGTVRVMRGDAKEMTPCV